MTKDTIHRLVGASIIIAVGLTGIWFMAHSKYPKLESKPINNIDKWVDNAICGYRNITGATTTLTSEEFNQMYIEGGYDKERWEIYCEPK